MFLPGFGAIFWATILSSKVERAMRRSKDHPPCYRFKAQRNELAIKKGWMLRSLNAIEGDAIVWGENCCEMDAKVLGSNGATNYGRVDG